MNHESDVDSRAQQRTQRTWLLPLLARTKDACVLANSVISYPHLPSNFFDADDSKSTIWTFPLLVCSWSLDLKLFPVDPPHRRWICHLKETDDLIRSSLLTERPLPWPRRILGDRYAHGESYSTWSSSAPQKLVPDPLPRLGDNLARDQQNRSEGQQAKVEHKCTSAQ